MLPVSSYSKQPQERPRRPNLSQQLGQQSSSPLLPQISRPPKNRLRISSFISLSNSSESIDDELSDGQAPHPLCPIQSSPPSTSDCSSFLSITPAPSSSFLSISPNMSASPSSPEMNASSSLSPRITPSPCDNNTSSPLLINNITQTRQKTPGGMKKRPTPISTEGTTERFSRGAPDGQFISQDKRLETIKNHLQTTSFSLGSLIGKGSYGEIYHLIEKDELNSKEKLVIKILNEKDQNQQDIIFDENRGEQLGLRTDSDYVIKHSKCLYLHQGILTEQPVNGDAPIAVIMPYISGRDLNKWITHERQSGSFSIQRMNSIMLKIAEGTLSLHEAFIAHRDLKPDNVMVSEEKEIPIIMDLGTAKHYQSVNSKPETPTIGAEAYRAPEFQGNTPIIMGSFNEIGKQDVFSLGYMYYNLLLLSQTGDKPENAFLGSRSMFGVEDGHFEFFEKTPELKNYIPLLKGMLEKNPTERWNMQRVREFLESLNSIQDVLTQPPPLMGSSHSSRLNLFFGLRRPQPMLPSMLPSIGITHQPL